MSEFNFDKLKNLDIPDKWVDDTINASVKKEKTPILFVNFKKLVPAVACLLVVCLVSLVPFILKADKEILPVDTTETQSTESVSLITPTTEKETSTEQKEISTEATQEIREDNIDNVTPTQPVFSETRNDETVSETSEPTKSPTSATEEPTEPEEPTLPDVIVPSENNPNDSAYPNYSAGDCLVAISPSFLVGNRNVYCRIYNSDQEYIGDRNIFSDQHLASFYSGFGSVYYYLYSPQKAGIILEPGTYTYSFYNDHTVPICKATVIVS